MNAAMKNREKVSENAFQQFVSRFSQLDVLRSQELLPRMIWNLKKRFFKCTEMKKEKNVGFQFHNNNTIKLSLMQSRLKR